MLEPGARSNQAEVAMAQAALRWAESNSVMSSKVRTISPPTPPSSSASASASRSRVGLPLRV